jgi:hypothetical protein
MVLKKAVEISPNTLGSISFNKDIYSNKIVGFTYQLEITILDKSNCIFDYRLVKIFDYKNQLLQILSDKEIGKNLILSKNQSVGFSTFIKSTCDSHEPDFFLAYERYSNFKTGYQFDFSPIDTILHRDYLYSRHEFMELRDSVVKYFYFNSPKFLRVVVEPYTRKVFIKEFDPSKEFDGKYKQLDFIRSLTNGKLPNGAEENYRSYNKVIQN